MWDAAKVVIRGKFVVIRDYIKKINNISHEQLNFIPQGIIRTTRKKRQMEPKVNR